MTVARQPRSGPSLLVIFAVGTLVFAPRLASGQQPAKADSMRAQMEQTSAMMGPMMGQMMEAMMEGMLKVMEKPENAQRLASFTGNYYDARVRKGFTKEQGLQIVIASGMPRLPSGPR